MEVVSERLNAEISMKKPSKTTRQWKSFWNLSKTTPATSMESALSWKDDYERDFSIGELNFCKKKQ